MSTCFLLKSPVFSIPIRARLASPPEAWSDSRPLPWGSSCRRGVGTVALFWSFLEGRNGGAKNMENMENMEIHRKYEKNRVERIFGGPRIFDEHGGKMICKSAIEQGVSLIQTRCKYWSLRMLKRIGTGAGKDSLTRGSRVWTLDTHGWKSPDTGIIYRHPPNCSVLAVQSTRSVWKTHIHTSAAELQILSGFIPYVWRV